ncbi:hypothetical protein BN7_3392 [Wickerhamomyces ciferrii]|uniref:Uncharacterized protein n=1 Tax=Wickerhamomyces ciferrii (strain ATCC 14091 / BCRC 22168 / CBS 111 / JCM 3599 / NBRC 0793 / NRRL Y-1031 F-60-10) TaxID=1206466 RepID=K0KRA7_WICCF|nr:uncharacterized protein BN7_3392 [Wickerhamomyces ciferrii]CCH43838.1 hypothetical protein BN7_3392 [Wickerhamomyces ciferrii]
MVDNNNLFDDIPVENNNTVDSQDIEDEIEMEMALDSLPYSESVFNIVPCFHNVCTCSKRLMPDRDELERLILERPYFTDLPVPLNDSFKIHNFKKIERSEDIKDKSFKRVSPKVPIKTFLFVFKEDVIGSNRTKSMDNHSCLYIRGLSKQYEHNLNDCLISHVERILNDLVEEEKNFINDKLQNGKEYNGYDLQSIDSFEPSFPNINDLMNDFLLGSNPFSIQLKPSLIPPKQVLKTLLSVLYSGVEIEERPGFMAEYRNDEYSVLIVADDELKEPKFLKYCEQKFESYFNELYVKEGKVVIKQNESIWLTPSKNNYKLIDTEPPIYSKL